MVQLYPPNRWTGLCRYLWEQLRYRAGSFYRELWGLKSELACNDDSCGLQSQINFSVTAGVPVLIQVASFAGGGGGTLAFNFCAFGTDTDGDGVDNCADNCLTVANLTRRIVTEMASATPVIAALRIPHSMTSMGTGSVVTAMSVPLGVISAPLASTPTRRTAIRMGWAMPVTTAPLSLTLTRRIMTAMVSATPAISAPLASTLIRRIVTGMASGMPVTTAPGAVANPDQADNDFDGLGDVCDPTPVHDLAIESLKASNVTIQRKVGSATINANVSVQNYRITLSRPFLTLPSPGCLPGAR